ncbi:MAG TPA: hypothetical protein VF701_02265, partial [Thermoanaerobaculia bacterium]
TAALSVTSAATAESIDMDDPRRALGRQDDIRVDAQILSETVSPGAPIAVTCQIQNLTSYPVAVADRVAAATYDSETRTITLSLGSEVPADGNLPRLVTIEPGEKLVFRAAATAAFGAAGARPGVAEPRYVQVKVSILRNLVPFHALIANQSRGPQTLSDELFDSWFESKDTIFLNTVPVHFVPSRLNGSAAQRSARGSF